MRFVFRLERVLEWARLHERAKQIEVSALQARLAAARRASVALSTKVREMLQPETTDVARWQLRSAEALRLKEQQLEIERGIAVLEQELGGACACLTRLHQRRKGLESVREKRARDHRAGQNLKERKRLDEVASRRRG